MQAVSKTLLQQNPPGFNWVCRLTQVVLYNGRKKVVVVMLWKRTSENKCQFFPGLSRQSAATLLWTVKVLAE